MLRAIEVNPAARYSMYSKKNGASRLRERRPTYSMLGLAVCSATGDGQLCQYRARQCDEDRAHRHPAKLPSGRHNIRPGQRATLNFLASVTSNVAITFGPPAHIVNGKLACEVLRIVGPRSEDIGPRRTRILDLLPVEGDPVIEPGPPVKSTVMPSVTSPSVHENALHACNLPPMSTADRMRRRTCLPGSMSLGPVTSQAYLRTASATLVIDAAAAGIRRAGAECEADQGPLRSGFALPVATRSPLRSPEIAVCRAA